MDAQTESMGRPSDVELLKQRYHKASSHAIALDGALDYAPASGALPGDCCASESFRRAFQPCVEEWVRLAAPPSLRTPHPATGRVIDVGVSVYADDLFMTHPDPRPPIRPARTPLSKTHSPWPSTTPTPHSTP